MFIAIIPNHNSFTAILLYEFYRANGKVKGRTLANCSYFDSEIIDRTKRRLKGKLLFLPWKSSKVSTINNTIMFWWVWRLMKRIDLASVTSSRLLRKGVPVLAMVVFRFLYLEVNWPLRQTGGR